MRPGLRSLQRPAAKVSWRRQAMVQSLGVNTNVGVARIRGYRLSAHDTAGPDTKVRAIERYFKGNKREVLVSQESCFVSSRTQVAVMQVITCLLQRAVQLTRPATTNTAKLLTAIVHCWWLTTDGDGQRGAGQCGNGETAEAATFCSLLILIAMHRGYVCSST